MSGKQPHIHLFVESVNAGLLLWFICVASGHAMVFIIPLPVFIKSFQTAVWRTIDLPVPRHVVLFAVPEASFNKTRGKLSFHYTVFSNVLFAPFCLLYSKIEKERGRKRERGGGERCISDRLVVETLRRVL